MCILSLQRLECHLGIDVEIFNEIVQRVQK